MPKILRANPESPNNIKMLELKVYNLSLQITVIILYSRISQTKYLTFCHRLIRSRVF
jgi:hypothetical protein